MKLADGWLEQNDASELDATAIVDVEYVEGTREFNMKVAAVAWSRVAAYRPHAPVVEEEASVTLNEARLAMLRVSADVDIGAVPLPQQIQRIADYLDQQVAGQILNNENVDELRAENKHFREFVVNAMKTRIHDAVLVAEGATLEARVCIAIARGHLPVDFMGSLDEWTA